MKLKVKPEYKALLPSLSNSALTILKESIRLKGQIYPIAYNENGVILDGHHRLHICEELGIKPLIEETPRVFDNLQDEKLFVIETNLKRRQLNSAQISFLGLKLLEIEKEPAKQRRIKHAKSNEPISSNELKGQARDIVAKKIGISPITFQRAITVLEKGDEKTKNKMLSGDTSIYYAYKMTKRKQESNNYPDLPEGKFNIIYADPPWRYDLPFAGSPDMHYTTMTTEEICRLEIPSSEEAVLFLWATNPFLKDALRVMESWGFSYKTNIVWVKERAGTGYWVRGKHELLLIGVKGKMHPPIETNRPESIIYAHKQKHSKKPEEAYCKIESMFPKGKYLELFARSKRDKWTMWGNEIES